MGRILAGVVAIVVLLGSAVEVRAQASGSPVAIERPSSDPHWVQGQATVSAPPEVVWSRLQNVAEWPRLLSDIERLEVKEHRGSHWEIELETRTLGHGELPYHVDFEPPPQRRVRFWRSGSGVAAQAFLLVREGPTPQQSNVVYTLYLKVTGLPHLLISDESLGKKQEHMVAVTLTDLEHAFAPP